MLLGCATVRPVPVKTETVINYIDSLVLRDSTVIIPKEKIVDVVPTYDTLKMETSMAAASAWVDTTTHTLKGKLENKQGIQYKYIYKDRVEYRDSLVYKDIPVPIEVVKKTHYGYEKWLWGYVVVSLLAIVLYILLKKKGF